jgi:hypothetical protein
MKESGCVRFTMNIIRSTLIPIPAEFLIRIEVLQKIRRPSRQTRGSSGTASGTAQRWGSGTSITPPRRRGGRCWSSGTLSGSGWRRRWGHLDQFQIEGFEQQAILGDMLRLLTMANGTNSIAAKSLLPTVAYPFFHRTSEPAN